MLVSCSNGCEESRDTTCGISFTSISGNQFAQVSITSLAKTDVIGDTTIVFKDSTFQILGSRTPQQELKLDPNSNYTSYAMEIVFSSFGDTFVAYDTLGVFYNTETHYLDMECGCTVYFNLDSIHSTNHLIQNAIIQNRLVTNTSSQININLEF